MSAPREFAPAADATTRNQSNPSLKMFAPRAFAPLALRLCTLADPCAISQPRSQERLPLPIEKIDLSRRYLRTSQLEPLSCALYSGLNNQLRIISARQIKDQRLTPYYPQFRRSRPIVRPPLMTGPPETRPAPLDDHN
ncbi:hypothetical protein PCANC_10706 [Puccinia coronata f. sp. avenae]|uniref:Uncharacterized protein n=1 Tax=Puccinia coronata f. sp. avenae TaxID=200324 RepID=A0A2N5VG59_9BASI|nr:hypothetical protein PCASD_10882 [Puccinia coronata f. sp. avenae]PLW48974.1 hypothetical protein PCANC_10706 [Puccinia coronata f. sp. avenae]